MRALRRSFDALYWACVAFGGTALVLISAVIPWAVYTRYVLNRAASWPEAFAVLLTIVLTFFGGAACYRGGRHMSISVFVALLPDGLRRAVAVLAEALVGVAYVYTQNQVELVAAGFGLTLCAYALVALGFGLYIPELFPTRLRLRGVSVANGCGRLASAGVQFVIVALFTNFGIAAVAAFLVPIPPRPVLPDPAAMDHTVHPAVVPEKD